MPLYDRAILCTYRSRGLAVLRDCSFGSGRGLNVEEHWSSLFSYTWRLVVGRVSLLTAAQVKVEYEVLTMVIPSLGDSSRLCSMYTNKE
jgi:hypothetical protein